MKTLFYTACLLLVLSGYSQWQAFALQVVELARQQLPQPLAEYLPDSTQAAASATVAGQEARIFALLKDSLRRLSESGSLNDARVELKQVRFIPANTVSRLRVNATDKTRRTEETAKAMSSTGYYVATINYDLLSPLTVESGTNLLSAACACGLAQVRLSDGFGVVKTFRCPNAGN